MLFPRKSLISAILAIVAVLGVASTEASEFYKLEIIAKTGDAVVGATDPLGPIASESGSINDDGDVAFVGQFGTSSFLGNGVMVGDGTSDPLLVSQGFISPTRVFSNGAQINNARQIVARDRVAGSPPSTFIRI